jgi:hypothetical protein
MVWFVAEAQAVPWFRSVLVDDAFEVAMGDGVDPSSPGVVCVRTGDAMHLPYARPGALQTIGFANRLSVWPDLDGDGLRDLTVADPTTFVAGPARDDWGTVLADFAGTGAPDPARVGDLDGDGDPDALHDTEPRWLENDGHGHFPRSHPVPVDQALAVADFDGDGARDILGVDDVAGVTSYVLVPGDGAGGLGQRVVIDAVGPLGVFSAAVDVDHDGDVDVVIPAIATTEWLEHTGAGLAPRATLSPVWGLNHVAVADVDGDGSPDLVGDDSGYPSGVVVVPRTPTGWGAGTLIDSASPVHAVAFVDADADGDHDVVVIDEFWYSLRAVLLRNPGFLDTDGDGLSNVAEGERGTTPDDADTDDDGLPDGDELRRWRTDPLDPVDAGRIDRDGDGVTDADEAAAGSDPERGDSDADGAWDLAEAARGTDPTAPDTDGDGALDGDESWCGSDPLDASSIDVDCDGLDGAAEAAAGTDPADADSDDDGLADGSDADPLDPDADDGGALDGREVALGSDPHDPYDDWPEHFITDVEQLHRIVPADLDGDGDVDLLVHAFGLSWWEQKQDGFHRTPLPAPYSWELGVMDVDGDGSADVVSGVQVAYGPAFDAFEALDGALGLYGGVVWMDGDGDGDLDLWLEDQDGDLTGYEQTAAGLVDRGRSSTDGCDVDWTLKTEDIDGDGDQDAWVTACWIENLGGFRVVTHPVPFGEQVDRDGDGDTDVSAFTYGGIADHANLGRGAFVEVASWPYTDNGCSTRVADLGDGAPTRFLTTYDSPVVGSADPATARPLDDDGYCDWLALADVDGDGDLDLFAGAAANDGEVRWFENRSPCFHDGDGDGFGGPTVTCGPAGLHRGGDCDDQDAAVYPTAPEWCNGLDDDCTGVADDLPAPLVWFDDVDGDGFGDPATAREQCADAPPGATLVGGDCDDADPQVAPDVVERACNGLDDDCDGEVLDRDGDGDGVGCVVDCDDGDVERGAPLPEVCDGEDQDCDGVADDGVLTTFYVDEDGDGVGGETIVEACLTPEGTTPLTGDCDDHDPQVIDCPTEPDPDPREAPHRPERAGCGCTSSPTGAGAWVIALSAIALRRRVRSRG